MDDSKRLERIEGKLDRVEDKVSVLANHMDVYNEQLKIHIEGTIQNRNDIKPLQRHVAMMEGALKLLGVLALILGLIKAFK